MNEERLKEANAILKDFLKVIKVVSMYPEDNPLPQSVKQSFAESLQGFVETRGELVLAVESNKLLTEGHVVFTDRSREERLAGLFFEAGVTEIVFKLGLEASGIYRLLDVVKNYLNAHQKDEDLAGLLWEAAIPGFNLATLEDVRLAEYDSGFDLKRYLGTESSGEAIFGAESAESYQAVFDAEEVESGAIDLGDTDPVVTGGGVPADRSPDAAGNESGPAGALDYAYEAIGGIGLGSDAVLPSGKKIKGDTTLILNDEFKLSEEQGQVISEMISGDASFDPFRSTLALLQELLAQEDAIEDFRESVTICEKLHSEFISHGRLSEAGQLMAHLHDVERSHNDTPIWAERLHDAQITFGSRDRLRILADSLNARPEIGAGEVHRYLDHFGWEALSGITDLLGDLENRTHRETLRDYLISRGQEKVEVVSKGLYDKRWYVVRNSVTIMAGIGDAASLATLKHVARHPERRVRLELVNCIRSAPGEQALALLRSLTADEDSEIRALAIAAITSRRGPEAYNAIVQIIDDHDIESLPRAELQALLNGLSTLGGGEAVAFLASLAAKLNIVHDETGTRFRKAAFEALSLNRSEKAGKALRKLSRSLRPDIRRQASAALLRREKMAEGN